MNLDLQQRSEIEKEIVGALKDAIHAHGPITSENINSAAKRIYKALGNLAKKRRDTEAQRKKSAVHSMCQLQERYFPDKVNVECPYCGHNLLREREAAERWQSEWLT